jgi:hypothetical protein
MPLTDLLDGAVGPLETRIDLADLRRRVGSRRASRRRIRAAAAITLSTLAAAAALALVHTAKDQPAVTAAASAAGVFPERTGSVAVLDDGYDGIVAIDLDHRVAVRRPVDGQRAGDQPFRLTRVASSLIVGWGDVYAAPLDGSAPHRLGTATISIPAAEPGRVWLVEYPGGRIGVGTPTLREVDLTGRIIVQAAGLDPARYVPALGIPGGVAYESRVGIALWNVARGRIVRVLPTSASVASFAVAGHGSTIAWCDSLCFTLRLTDTQSSRPDVVARTPTSTLAFQARSARFSPDGRQLAVVATTPGPVDPRAKGEIVLIDTRTGASRAITGRSWSPFTALAWSGDGRRLLFSSNTTIGEYLLRDRQVRTATLGFPIGTLGVVAQRLEAAGLVEGAQLGEPTACRPPVVQPSGRAGACAFRF